MKVQNIADKLESAQADLSVSGFDDMKFADTQFRAVNLSEVARADCAIESMTLEGVSVTVVMAACRDSRKG